VSSKVAKIPKRPALNFARGNRRVKELALTFDAGAGANYTHNILEILRVKGIQTTIFLTGQFIEKHPDIVKRIVADGHECGNHTYSHPHLTNYNKNYRHSTKRGVTKDFFQDELRKTSDLFTALTGEKMVHWWRAPYGEHNTQIRRWAEEVGFKHVDWSRGPGRKNYDILDWVANESSKYYLTSDELYERFVNLDDGVPGRANGGIILMHLSTDRKKDFPHNTLASAIDAMRSKGYEFVSVSDMFEN
jgi:peptidoglycan/xylan/chitin deacetylase (PgdA/CDA1 family)